MLHSYLACFPSPPICSVSPSIALWEWMRLPSPLIVRKRQANSTPWPSAATMPSGSVPILDHGFSVDLFLVLPTSRQGTYSRPHKTEGLGSLVD